MKHGTLVLPSERARHFIDLLGRKANVQFVDMNERTMRRQYKRYIQRLEEMERILRFLHEEIARHEFNVTKGSVEAFLESDTETYQLDQVEDSLKRLYEQFSRFKENNSDLLTEKNNAIEEKYVAMAALASLHEGGVMGGVGTMPTRRQTEHATQSLLQAHIEAPHLVDDTMAFSNIAGVINQADQERFARTLFRVTRGNTFTHFQMINDKIYDAKTGKEVAKSVFVVYYQGAESSAMYEKLTKVCNAFGVSMYPWPASYNDAVSRIEDLTTTIEDKAKALDAFEQYILGEIRDLLEVPGGPPPEGADLEELRSSRIEEWRLFCQKEKSIYATLNMFEGDITLRANCWYPSAEEDMIRHLLLSQSNKQQVSAFLLSDKERTTKTPPTYIRRTEFSYAFQELVDTYGIPRYQEANPGLFTIITFPFLFGVMYGDIGHGACVLLFGMYLLIFADSLKRGDGPLKGMVAARYMIALMGFFATYAGFIYNDFLSIGFVLAPSHFKEPPGVHHGGGEHGGGEEGGGASQTQFVEWQIDPSSKPTPFGLDWAWKGAQNELLFLNSYKMKFAVLVGVAQMGLGVVLKAFNTIHFAKPLDFFFEFVPQIIFLVALFGYMDFMIVFKWMTPGPLQADLDPSVKAVNKPGLINTMINMCLAPMKGSAIDPSEQLFGGQETIQNILLILCAISIPVMLFPKPIGLLIWHKMHPPRTVHHDDGDDEERGEGEHHDDDEEDEHEHFNFSEEFIHQVIETIEYVLGTISNTASYLRLWALSLAHQQLALVFFEKAILGFIESDANVVLRAVELFFGFAVFAAITFGVLLCMDVLECFLHALRLQWVEFQNKFYKGDGYKFAPFNHKAILSTGEGDL
ncbi:unnamed protein product [Vitrella brassicaformis CCMP3155]|uniref:V-type proton ATPase subunit a n=1 Tax=Vitrella brassicaformis (strain CCMP3155) TaxID=1169540 RepID=A0A0G4GDJ0_VITBC|nr:unnamed protein product [Vitrella brassicaformis CCMP3155]|eukprot:CEM27242.1 unnamed protein product [Vitrella brassicaformis CCMP3155]